MSFPFNLGQPYVCGAGYVMCTDWHLDLTIGGERKQTFTIEAYGDVFYDASQPPTTGPAAPPAPEPMPRRFIRDETGRFVSEVIPSDGSLARLFSEEHIRPAQHTFANGQFTPISPPSHHRQTPSSPRLPHAPLPASSTRCAAAGASSRPRPHGKRGPDLSPSHCLALQSVHLPPKAA